MYTDDDLDQAVIKGIFTDDAVATFREDVLKRDNTQCADEERIKLVASFNDIFVLMACALLLLSTGWILHDINSAIAMIVVAALSWLLAEFFVLKRAMALPAIALLISFVGGVFSSVVLLFLQTTEHVIMLAGFAGSVAAWFHWKRFKVPITVAAGAATAFTFVLALFISLFPVLKTYLMLLMLIGGVGIFYIAMRWDRQDLKRITAKSDVAFWLHITAAPLIVHPIFSSLGIFDGNQNTLSLVLILAVYIILTFVSLVIDRRAFMVSSLLYVLTALSDLLNTYGLENDSFAYVGVVIGFSLLLLSGFWHKVRHQLIIRLPKQLQVIVPA